MKRVLVLVPVDVPDDTDPADVPAVIGNALEYSGDSSEINWDELGWQMGHPFPVNGTALPAAAAEMCVKSFRITE